MIIFGEIIFLGKLGLYSPAYMCNICAFFVSYKLDVICLVKYHYTKLKRVEAFLIPCSFFYYTGCLQKLVLTWVSFLLVDNNNNSNIYLYYPTNQTRSKKDTLMSIYT